MFVAYGSRELLQQLQLNVEPLLSDSEQLQDLLDRAETAGFEFDD